MRDRKCTAHRGHHEAQQGRVDCELEYDLAAVRGGDLAGAPDAHVHEAETTRDEERADDRLAAGETIPMLLDETIEAGIRNRRSEEREGCRPLRLAPRMRGKRTSMALPA